MVSIPGTEQAKEAVIANQIPQTATVQRSQTKLTVSYDGAPQLSPIVGTSMEYAINTSSEVIHAAGRYYAVNNGIWFVADVCHRTLGRGRQYSRRDLLHPSQQSAVS